MFDSGEVFELLTIAKQVLEFPQLRAIHDEAVERLEEINAHCSTAPKYEQETTYEKLPEPLPSAPLGDARCQEETKQEEPDQRSLMNQPTPGDSSNNETPSEVTRRQI